MTNFREGIPFNSKAQHRTGKQIKEHFSIHG